MLAIDVLPPAVALARRNGVDAVLADAAAWQPPHRQWDVVYADGVLGHMYDPVRGAIFNLARMRTWLAPGCGVLVVSNDIAPAGEEVRPAPGIPGFYWLSTLFIADELVTAGYDVISAEEFAYKRPRSGIRRRAVLEARSAR